MQNDDYYARKNNNIETTNEISVIDSILGNTVQLKTIWGLEKVSIPKFAETGDTIKLQNKGI